MSTRSVLSRYAGVLMALAMTVIVVLAVAGPEALRWPMIVWGMALILLWVQRTPPGRSPRR